MGLNTKTPDYETYKIIYRDSIFLNAKLYVEPAYKLICLFFNYLGFTFQQFRMIWAAVYSLVLLAAVKKLSIKPNITLALYLLWPCVSFVSGMRFALASVLVCLGTSYLIENNWKGIIKFIVIVLIGASIHRSVLFYLVFIFARKKFTGKQYLIIFSAILLLTMSLYTGLIASIAQSVFSGELEYKIFRWTSLDSDTGVVHLNMMGFIVNISFVIIFTFLINEMSKPIIRFAKLKRNELQTVQYIKIIQTVTLYKNISMCLLLTIPLYIITQEYSRLLYGILLIYYSEFTYFWSAGKIMKYEDKVFYKLSFVAMVFLTVAYYIYSTPTHDIFATLVDNLLFTK